MVAQRHAADQPVVHRVRRFPADHLFIDTQGSARDLSHCAETVGRWHAGLLDRHPCALLPLLEPLVIGDRVEDLLGRRREVLVDLELDHRAADTTGRGGVKAPSWPDASGFTRNRPVFTLERHGGDRVRRGLESQSCVHESWGRSLKMPRLQI